MARTEISAADALKAFKTKPSVQLAKAGKVPVLDEHGKKVGEKNGFITSSASATEAHVVGAAKYDDGRVVMVTLDGQKHEARA